MKRRIARKIYKAFYSWKPNYWNGYRVVIFVRFSHARTHACSTYDSWSPKSVFEKAYKCADSFIDRLQIEHDELKERYNKLDNFLESGKAEKVCEENQIWLMALQRINMQNYLGNLATRLKFLKDAPSQTQG